MVEPGWLHAVSEAEHVAWSSISVGALLDAEETSA
jgi:hypothetical protein